MVNYDRLLSRPLPLKNSSKNRTFLTFWISFGHLWCPNLFRLHMVLIWINLELFWCFLLLSVYLDILIHVNNCIKRGRTVRRHSQISLCRNLMYFNETKNSFERDQVHTFKCVTFDLFKWFEIKSFFLKFIFFQDNPGKKRLNFIPGESSKKNEEFFPD